MEATDQEVFEREATRTVETRFWPAPWEGPKPVVFNATVAAASEDASMLIEDGIQHRMAVAIGQQLLPKHSDLVEAELRRHHRKEVETSRETRFDLVEATALASLVVSAAALAWTIGKDLGWWTKGSPRPSRTTIEHEVRKELTTKLKYNEPGLEPLIETTVSEVVRVVAERD